MTIKHYLTPIRQYNSFYDIIKTKNDAQDILENIVLKQGAIYFPKIEDPHVHIVIKASNLKMDVYGNILEKDVPMIPENKKITIYEYNSNEILQSSDNISISYNFVDAVDLFYRLRKHFNHYKKNN